MYLVFYFFHPIKQFIHQLWNKACRWSHKYVLFTVKYSFFTTTKITRFFYDIFRHNTMKFFQFFYAVKSDFGYLFIGIISVLHLLYFFCFSKNHFPVDNISHLRQ